MEHASIRNPHAAARSAAKEARPVPTTQAMGTAMPAAGPCACGGRCPRCSGAALQRKPRLGAPGDRFDREPDAFADQVMRMASAAPVSSAVTNLQRRCTDCEDEAEGATIRRDAGVADAAGAQSPDTEAAARAAQQGGAPLSPQ